MYIAYDERGDLLYVPLRAGDSDALSRDVGGGRFLESDGDGPVSVEFLNVSAGIDLEGLPLAGEIEQSLRALSDLLARSLRTSRT